MDADLQGLLGKLDELAMGSSVMEYQLSIVQAKSRLYQIQADRDRNNNLTAGIGGMTALAGTNRDELIERIYINLLETYMRPSTTVVTQSHDSMLAEAQADAKRLALAAWSVYQEISGSKAAWS